MAFWLCPGGWGVRSLTVGAYANVALARPAIASFHQAGATTALDDSDHGIRPMGPCPRRLPTEVAVIIHYESCTYAGWRRKFGQRKRPIADQNGDVFSLFTPATPPHSAHPTHEHGHS